MASSDQHSVRSIDESLEDINGIDGSRTHQMDDADIGGILLAGRPGQVRSRIGAPVAKKSYNPRFKLSHLVPPSSSQSAKRESGFAQFLEFLGFIEFIVLTQQTQRTQ
jgi:hypothetical protein